MDEQILKSLNYYDGIANGYSRLYHEEQILKISKILNYLPKNKLILDLGSGDGVFNQFVFKNSNESKLISLDLSLNLLKINSNHKKINASILKLPIKNNSFEFIVSFTVFQDLPDPIKGIDETSRILKKDGIFIITFLKVSIKAEKMLKYLEKKFKIIEKIEETKDWILILKKE